MESSQEKSVEHEINHVKKNHKQKQNVQSITMKKRRNEFNHTSIKSNVQNHLVTTKTNESSQKLSVSKEVSNAMKEKVKKSDVQRITSNHSRTKCAKTN